MASRGARSKSPAPNRRTNTPRSRSPAGSRRKSATPSNAATRERVPRSGRSPARREGGSETANVSKPAASLPARSQSARSKSASKEKKVLSVAGVSISKVLFPARRVDGHISQFRIALPGNGPLDTAAPCFLIIPTSPECHHSPPGLHSIGRDRAASDGAAIAPDISQCLSLSAYMP